MSGMIIDGRKIKALHRLHEIIAYTGQTEELRDTIWQGLLLDEDLMREFFYYLDHHSFADEYKFEGYGLTDLYFWCLYQYNIRRDIGKNPTDCDKEAIVMETFYHMIRMKERPEDYHRWLTNGTGMDIM